MMAETVKFLFSAAAFCLALVGLAFLLTGCDTVKYADCIVRDNTRNPCN